MEKSGFADDASAPSPSDRGAEPVSEAAPEDPAIETLRRRRAMFVEPENEPKHDRGFFLASAVNSIGRTPRTKAPLGKGTHTVDSTDGVKLCVKTWPSKSLEEDPNSASEKLLVVLVHQYSVMGGCQELLVGLARHLNMLGFSCVTFDERGVGGSTGSKSVTGGPEVHDVISVCQWAAHTYNRRLLVVGSSAGAPIAGSAVDSVDAVDGYVAVGYVFGFWASLIFGSHFTKILDSPKPKLFIMGTTDCFTSVKQLQVKVAKAKGVAEIHLIEGYGHFEIESPMFDGPIAELIGKFVETIEADSGGS